MIIVKQNVIYQVVTSVISSGRNLSKRENISVPLMYEWYEEYYLGGAHGIAGILYLILQVSFFVLGIRFRRKKGTGNCIVRKNMCPSYVRMA